MNYRLPFLATCLMTAAIAGCGPSPPDIPIRQSHSGTVNTGIDSNDERVVALVSWLQHKGVTLELIRAAKDYTEWRVTQPKTSDEYDVVFSIRSFPPEASEEQMHEALDVSLAYMLNAPAHLAMSYGGFRGTHPDAELPKSDNELSRVNGLPITKVIERWFMDYKPGLSVAAPDRGRTGDPAKDLAAILVAGQWVKDHGTPPLQDQHAYTFAKDGRYTYKLVTDHTTPTVTGRWELAAGKDGKVLLRLKDQEGQKDYYWLDRESFVRYDPKKDVLLVSGERYDGEQPLRHVKGEKKAK